MIPRKAALTTLLAGAAAALHLLSPQSHTQGSVDAARLSQPERSVVCTETLLNGGFELGPEPGWHLDTDVVDWLSGEPIELDDVILHNDDFGQDTAVEGDWAAQMGGGPDYEMWLVQSTPVPMLPEDELITATLRYAFAYDTEEWPNGRPDDLFAAYLIDDSGREIQIEGTGFSEEEQLPTKVWLLIDADITEMMWSNLPAATRQVAFYSLSSGFDFTTHLLDAVSLELCVLASPTATASHTPQPTLAPTATQEAPTSVPAPPAVWLPSVSSD